MDALPLARQGMSKRYCNSDGWGGGGTDEWDEPLPKSKKKQKYKNRGRKKQFHMLPYHKFNPVELHKDTIRLVLELQLVNNGIRPIFVRS